MQVYLSLAACYSLNRELGIVKLLNSIIIRSAMTFIINEIFHSIQGESTLAGLPFVFVRLTGCNLRCRYCDTRYAYKEGRPMEIGEVLSHVARFNCERVTITGGEPLLQEATSGLVSQLINSRFQVSVETNGSLDISALDQRCTRVVDIKCPSSGMQQHNLPSNLKQLGVNDQLKFVIADREDFEFACRTIGEMDHQLSAGNILFSPAHTQLAPRALANWMIEAGTDARLQLQLHKYIWPDIDRGV